MPRLPVTEPVLLFSVKAPRPWAGFVERPVVTDDAILVAGSGTYARLSLDTGKPIFTVSVQHASAESYIGLPFPLSDGRTLMPVYEKDAWFRVFVIAPDGTIDASDSPGSEEQALGNDMRIVTHDAGCKFFLMPIAKATGLGSNDYLVSWIYRQVRFFRTECRSLKTGLRWGSDEAMLTTTSGVVVGVTAPVRGTDKRGTIVARSIDDGTELWTLDAHQKTVAAAYAGLVMVIDRSARFVEHVTRRIACEEDLMNAIAEEPGLMGAALDRLQRELLSQRPLQTPTRLSARSALTGAERWNALVPGEIVSIGTNGNVLALVGVEGTTATLYRHDLATGTLLAATSLGAGWPVSPLDPWSTRASFDLWSTELPTIVDMDEDVLLWASPEALIAERIHAPFEKLWTWTLPAPCRAFRPRAVDRFLSEPAITGGRDRIFLRDGWSLWGIGSKR
ncbi:MAG: hypothetical protein IPM54_40810 [Polyangiaceae bacterium]|nr:hypothetical protein [Polyangiaceae bacterium]